MKQIIKESPIIRKLILALTLMASSTSFAASNPCVENALDVAYVNHNVSEESKFSDQIIVCLKENNEFKTGVLDVMSFI